MTCDHPDEDTGIDTVIKCERNFGSDGILDPNERNTDHAFTIGSRGKKMASPTLLDHVHIFGIDLTDTHDLPSKE